MSLAHKLLRLIVDYLPNEQLLEFQEYVREHDPELYSMVSDSEHSVPPSLLKTAVRSGKMSDVKLLIDQGLYSNDDVAVMSAQQGNDQIVFELLQSDVQPSQELFNAACIGGNLNLAQNIEKLISGDSEYLSDKTYQLDYNTPLRGAILKCRENILKWLMTKEIAPDFESISTILPHVNDPTIVELIINATPSVNKSMVTKYLDQMQQPTYLGIRTAAAYCKWDLVDSQIDNVNHTPEQLLNVASLLVRGNNIDILKKVVDKMSPELIVKFVDKSILDSQSIQMLDYLISLHVPSEEYWVRAAFKVGDKERLENIDIFKYIPQAFQGIVLGDRIDDAIEFITQAPWNDIINREFIDQTLKYATPTMKSTIQLLLN